MSFEYRKDVDGLRAVAIASVVLFHYGVSSFSNGFLGVDIFFVISGFLITSIIFREMDRGEFTYAKFYARRFRRILPALIAVVTVTTIVAWLILSPYDLRKYGITAIAALTGLSNVVFFWFVDYFSPNADKQLLLMTWSLGVEEQFYVIFPPVLALLIRCRKKLVLPVVGAITISSLVLAIGANMYRPEAAFYLLPFRAWELGVGSVLALASAKNLAPNFSRLTQNGMATIAVTIFALAIVSGNLAPIMTLNIAITVGAAMLIMSGQSFVNQKILSSGLFVGLGLISYSWYLWHWLPIAVAHVLQIELNSALQAGLIVLTLLAGLLSYRWVETPFRRGPSTHGRSVRRYGLAVAVACVPLAILVVTNGLHRFASPAIQAVDTNMLATMKNPCMAKYGETKLRLGDPCVPAERGPAIVLVGDSHANALAGGVRSLAAARNMQYRQFTKSSCPPLLGYTRYMPNHPTHDTECAAYMKAAVEAIGADRDVKVVVLAGYWASSFDDEQNGFRYVRDDADGQYVSLGQSRQNLGYGLTAMVDALRGRGRKVIVVQDVPRFTTDPLAIGLSALMPARAAFVQVVGQDEGRVRGDRMSPRTYVTDSARTIVQAATLNRPGVALLDPLPILCNADGCLFRGNGSMFYTDSQHLSEAGAVHIAARFTKSFGATQQ